MRIRTVLIGFGWSGREIWLPRLLARDDYEVVAAVDPDPATREAFTAATDRPAFADIDGLRAGDADLALVAAPNHVHASLGRSLLQRGFATFVEKPVCLTTAEADALADAERDGAGTLLAGSASRYRADVAELVKLVPELGRLRNVELAWERARGVPQSRGWFTNRAQAGGGVLLDLGWHLLDVLEEVVGPVSFDQVAASTSDDHANDPRWAAAWRHDRPAPDVEVDVEDTVRGFLVADTGLSVSVRASWATHSATHDATTIRVDGSEGTATLRTTFGFSPNREPRPRITAVRQGQAREIAVPVEPIGAEYDHQLDDIRHRLSDPSSRGRAIAGVRRIVATIEAIYAASAGPLVPGEPVATAAAPR
ncbi:oxidoreductase [Longispora fulva]|uniref:Oxidoreductase n=1 Tax=Longispora fulva TaxID=619741 RepID=A0A8J7GQP2_9ACTN|nr:Gfo/Idh/MocA family oxidoreductase [Longispora fulva]MBG6141563.1 oxidoreductase [Longispora fulva]GIG59284.1 oxidoreductase [Longispora fulva]